MAGIDRIVGKIEGRLDSIDARLSNIEEVLPTLQDDYSQRKGAGKVIYSVAGFVGGITGMLGSFLLGLIKP